MSQRLRRTRRRRPAAAPPDNAGPKNGPAKSDGERSPKTPSRHYRFERNIDKIVRRFDVSILESLSPHLTIEGLPEAFVLREIEKFLGDEDYKDFQWEDLRVYSGAFGVAHHSREDFILLQSPKYSPADIELGKVEIPYLPDREAEHKYKDLIDYLFIGRRSRQPLSGDHHASYAPEFFWHLAKIYHPSPAHAEGFHHHRLYRLSHFDRYLLKHKDVPYLYCPIGEVAFFIYAWRLLFRLSQKAGTAKAYPGGLSLMMQGSFDCRDVWDSEFWERPILSEDEETQVNALPEWGWIVALRNLKALMKGGADEGTVGFGESVLRQWETWRGQLDTDAALFYRGHPWVTDWVNMGLIRGSTMSVFQQAHARNTLLDLVLFASYIERRGDVRRELLEKAKLIRHSLRNKSALEWRVLFHLDARLQDVVRHLLTRQDAEKPSLLSMLYMLHRLARFPILPFFYWTAVDGRPKEHFVFPTLESWQFPVQVKVPADETSLLQHSETYLLPVVGVGLFTVEPMDRLSAAAYDHTLEFSPHADRESALADYHRLYERAYQRLSRIERLYRRIGRLMIDSAFYGNLVQEAVRREANLKIRSDLAATFSHAYQKRATMFVNSFREFLNRTLALDLTINLATKRSSSRLVNEFMSMGSIQDDPDGIPYAEIKDFDPPKLIKHSALAFAFDHREALEWYKADIETFYKISRFDKVFRKEKFREPTERESKNNQYLYFLTLVKLVESIIILKYQGSGADNSTYRSVFSDFQPKKEWSYLLIKGTYNLEHEGTGYLSDIEEIITSDKFPVNFDYSQETVSNPRLYLRMFDDTADLATRVWEQQLLVEVLGKVLGEIFLNSLQGMSQCANRMISIKYAKSETDVNIDITTPCGDKNLMARLESKFAPPQKPEYTQGWGRYGNRVIMKDYLQGRYLEKECEGSMVTRLVLPREILGERKTDE